MCVNRPRRTECLARQCVVGGSSLTRGEKATEFSVGGSPGRRDAAMLRVLRAGRRRRRWWCRRITALLPPPPPKERSARSERETEAESERSLTRTNVAAPAARRAPRTHAPESGSY